MSEPCSCGYGCDCGCCEGTEPLTPQTVANRPGLDALVYRVGTHSTFLETMQARLSTEALVGLTTREGGDPSIALLDAWAVVADVLTFYQERIANEGYLRTATERRSVLELARLVGYSPRPGVAAGTYLAYTLEERVKPAAGNGTPNSATATLDEPETLIPAGAAAQSVPGPGEVPQTFETSEDLVARAAWNNLRLRLTKPQQPEKLAGADRRPVAFYFKGIATNLKPNDPLLIWAGGADPDLYRAMSVEPDAEHGRTQVAVQLWEPPGAMFQNAVRAPFPRAALRESLEHATGSGTLPRGVLAERVAADLKPLKKALAAEAEESKLRAAVDQALHKLREAHAEALARNAHRLAPWIGGLVADLQAAATSEAESAAAAPRVGIVDQLDDDARIPTTSLANVLTSLGKPTRPQLGRAHFDRDPRKLFGPKSDLVAHLMTVAHPGLQDVLYQAWANLPATQPPPLKVCALRTRAAVFGHHAPKQLVPDPDQHHPFAFKSEEWELEEDVENVAWLDATYPQILPGSWIALLRPAASGGIKKLVITRVVGTAEQSRARYGLSAKATRLELAQPWLDIADPAGSDEQRDTFAVIRGTAVYAQCEDLELAEEPITKPLCGGEIELAQLYDGLEPGRWLVVTGVRADVLEDEKAVGAAGTAGSSLPPARAKVPGIPAAELVMLAAVDQGVLEDPRVEIGSAALAGERNHTTLTLATELAYCYEPATVQIFGNVAPATHGQTCFEVLGSGDAAQPHQSFTLKQPPLTYVSAPTPSGIESTLQVRVNDILWHQADCPAGLGPADRSYFVRTGDDANTTVVFGDGKRGAPLPSGSENVRARYRKGIGKQGNVKAGQISQLATRPLGVKDVVNPIPATGGADAESRDQARRNAPLAVMALDRLVSTQDYADFARTFAGIGKSSAVRLTDGRVELVHVTIAGEDDIPIREDSKLFMNLEAALRRLGDPRQPLALALRRLSFLVVQAEVRVLPDYLWEKVEPKIRAAMLEAFGFARRDLGQDALLSEVYRTIQRVAGVALVDVDLFAKRDPSQLEEPLDVDRQPEPRLRADLARIDGGAIEAAQLLYLTPAVADTLILKERKS